MTSPTGPTDTQEISLEPLHLIERSDAVLRLGAMMLACGTGSVRVKEAMQRVATAIGLDRIHAQITLTEIIATTARGQIFRTQVIAIPTSGVNSRMLSDLEAYTHQIQPGTTAQQVEDALDEIHDRHRRHPAWLTIAAASWACLAFAFLNNGGWQECLAVALAVAAGQAVRHALNLARFNPLGVAMIASAVSCLGYLGVAWAFAQLGGMSSLHDAGYTSAILFLVPGFPIMTAALDLARLDILSGLARLTYALLILLSAALSAWAIAWAFNLTPTAAGLPDISPALLVVGWMIAGFLGVLGFAIMFNSPWKMAAIAATIGGIANTFRLIAVNSGVVPQLSAMAATFLVGMLATVAVRCFVYPRITLSVPAVLIMIPGAAAYRTIVYLNQGQSIDALDSGIEVFFVIVSLAVGLAAARILSDREWRIPGHTHTSRHTRQNASADV